MLPADPGACPPLVSVVIVAYRHRDFVVQAIESAVSQDYPNLDIVVVDDGSPDDTHAVARAHLAARNPRGVRLLTRGNGGVSSAFNFGIAQARGEFIALLAADDYFVPDAVSHWMAIFERHPAPDVALVHTNTYVLYEDGRVASMDQQFAPAEGHCLMDMLTRDKGICGSSILFRRSAFDAVGGYDEQIHGEDFDFYARLAAKGYAFVYDRHHSTFKRERSTGLGNDLERWKPAPFATLEKHRALLTHAQYAHVRKRLYLYLMRLASQNGRYAQARSITSEFVGETHSRRWYFVLASLIARHQLVALMPNRVRAALRSVRGRLRAARTAERKLGMGVK